MCRRSALDLDLQCCLSSRRRSAFRCSRHWRRPCALPCASPCRPWMASSRLTRRGLPLVSTTAWTISSLRLSHRDSTLVLAASGLMYKDIVTGTGDTPEEGATVKVQYTGWIATTGKEFDSGSSTQHLASKRARRPRAARQHARSLSHASRLTPHASRLTLVGASIHARRHHSHSSSQSPSTWARVA